MGVWGEAYGAAVHCVWLEQLKGPAGRDVIDHTAAVFVSWKNKLKLLMERNIYKANDKKAKAV